MTGYIRPACGEMKVCDYEYYKSAYCGLCRRMGRICGSDCRITLSYDMVYLYLVRLVLTGENPQTAKRVCPANHLMRKKVPENSKELDYVAAVSGIMAAYRFRDGIADEKGVKRIGCRIGAGISKRWLRKAKIIHPGLEDGIKEKLDAFYDAEKQFAGNNDKAAADVLAGLFGDVLGFVFSYGFDAGDHVKPVASSVGRHTGRWLYCIDAIDDMTADAERHRFNPYLRLYESAALTDEEKITLNCLMGAEGGAALDALDLAPLNDGTGQCRRIIENILTKGMPSVAEQVLNGSYRKTQRDRI